MTSTVLPSKPVPQLDRAGHFIGWATAWASPLEPGVWHIPAGAIDVLPPDAPPGQWPRWNGAM